MKAKDFVIAILGLCLKVAVLMFAVVALYRVAGIAYDYGYRVFEEPPMSTAGREVHVTITKDMSPKKMGELFYSRGLIRDEKLFVLQYYASEFREDLKSGEFVLLTSMTVEEMMEAMTKEPKVPEEEDEELEGADYAPVDYDSGYDEADSWEE